MVGHRLGYPTYVLQAGAFLVGVLFFVYTSQSTAAARQAARTRMAFSDLLLRADFACSAAFPAETLPGKLAFIGKPIGSLVETLAAYADALQGHGVDPEAADLAYRAQR